MLASDDALLGWSPTGGDDEDVNVPQGMFLKALKPFPAPPSTTYLSPTCPPLDIPPPKACPSPSQSIPLAPLSRQAISHTPIAPSSDRRAQRNRKRDPSWIPRPRNAFIIFRCEYSRQHSQGSQDSQNEGEPDDATVKTLSKRAAEAWKDLPPSEKERYKQMAEKEREEHARLYPHYRFRPMKRQASGTRQTSSSSESCKLPKAASVERPPEASTVPSVLASALEKSRSSPSCERAEASFPMPYATTAPLLDPLSCSIGFPEDTQTQVPLQLDYNDPILFYPSSEATAMLPFDTSPLASTELYSPLCGLPSDADPFPCPDSTFGLDSTKEDMERAQALEAYAMGLYNFDVFSPFSFPEYG